MLRPRALGFALFGVVVLATSVALADAKEADRLFSEAEQLMKDGNLTEACRRYQSSLDADPAPGTQYRLAECLDKAGRRIESAKLLHDLAKIMEQKGDAERSKKAIDTAAQVESRTPKLRLDIPWAARVAGVTVKVDGAVVEPEKWKAPFPIDPGDHVVQVDAPDRASFETKLTAQDGGEVSVSVPEPPRTMAASAPPTKESSGWPWQRTAGIAAAGAGIVALGVGGVMVLGAKGTYDDAIVGCPANGCPRVKADEANDARGQANLGGIVAAVGLVLVGGGAVLWLTAPKPEAAKSTGWRVVPTVGPTGGGLHATARF